MKKSLTKICKEIDGLNHFLVFCPEVGPNSLMEMSTGTSTFLKLCRMCCGPSGAPLQREPKERFGMGSDFVEVDRKSKRFEHLRACCLELHGSATASFMVDWHTCARWCLLTCFCYYTLIELVCKKESIKALLPRGDEKSLDLMSSRSEQRKWEQAAMDSGLIASKSEGRRIWQTTLQAKRIADNSSSTVHRPCFFLQRCRCTEEVSGMLGHLQALGLLL